MTIRISSDFSAFIVVDDEHRRHVVHLDPAADAVPQGNQDWLFPAFMPGPGFRLMPEPEAI